MSKKEKIILSMSNLELEALEYHKKGRPGKLEITPTTPLNSSHDLSLAYSPGVATPCLEIEKNPDAIYDYTSKGNIVAVISNGTAVLGLGNIGASASKPVMEGKAVLFKKFADIDGIDLEIDTDDIDRFVDAVSLLGPSFGGINLEDIKAPDCFIIEQRLREMMDIPVFHDDQHGTAIVTAAGIINALHLTKRDIKNTKFVSNGAGAASIACVELLKAMGAKNENIILVDRDGVIFRGRQTNMNQWKSGHTVDTKARTLKDAIMGADVFLGLSVPGSVTKEMVLSMSEKPIIFAMANPTPEIMPEEVKSVRSDAIIATGRSDYPNQVNNVLGFPYIFRGALDVRASTINEEMKIAAAHAIAELARKDVPDEVNAAYEGINLHYGNDYIIPAPFDPRLISAVSSAVAKAAMDSGVAKKPIDDLEAYEKELAGRIDPIASILEPLKTKIKGKKIRVVFAEGEEEKTIRAALAFYNSGFGIPILIGREHRVKESMKKVDLDGLDELVIHNASLSKNNNKYIDSLYARLHRKGQLRRDCQRLINQDRNVFAASMVSEGDADAMITGVTRSFGRCFDDITKVIDAKNNQSFLSMSMMVSKERTVFIGDVNIHDRPSPEQLADIASGVANTVKNLGYNPRVALLSFSNFGNPSRPSSKNIREAVNILSERKVNFEFDGEMTAEIALDYDLIKQNYPFCRLSGPANVLIMPGLLSANISFKLLQKMGGGSVLGPLMIGGEKPFQIVQMGSTVSDLVNSASIAAYDALYIK
ncbi:NADP-dependent malic enzyme [Alphaproteobacteria bacterium]|nr:NADP-dependent malic enzyme [Alphaproteobacteria bacterium]